MVYHWLLTNFEHWSPMLTLTVLICVALFAHFVSDFLLQSSEEGQKKGKDIGTLNLHVAKYVVAMTMVVGPVLAIINGLFHWVTDYGFSKLKNKHADRKEWYAFFAYVGLDQYAHQLVLIISIYLLYADML